MTPEKTRECGNCRLADSWGIPLSKACELTCWPTASGGSRYIPLNGPVSSPSELPSEPKFKRGDHVRKVRGSAWNGLVVGEYSTTLTPEGYAVESSAHPGSVQIYPASALELVNYNEAAKGS